MDRGMVGTSAAGRHRIEARAVTPSRRPRTPRVTDSGAREQQDDPDTESASSSPGEDPEAPGFAGFAEADETVGTWMRGHVREFNRAVVGRLVLSYPTRDVVLADIDSHTALSILASFSQSTKAFTTKLSPNETLAYDSVYTVAPGFLVGWFEPDVVNVDGFPADIVALVGPR